MLLQSAGFVFTPTDQEKADRLLHVRYSSVRDEYCRLSNNCEVIQTWDRCLWTKESVFRKVEHDWEMVCSGILVGSLKSNVGMHKLGWFHLL